MLPECIGVGCKFLNALQLQRVVVVGDLKLGRNHVVLKLDNGLRARERVIRVSARHSELASRGGHELSIPPTSCKC